MTPAEIPVEMTIAELAEALGLSRGVVRARVDSGAIPSSRRGRKGGRIVVSLVALRDAMPDLYLALLERLAAREGA